MTQAAAAPDGLRLPRPGARAAGLWTAAAAIVLAGHVAVAYGLQNLSFADADGGPPPTLAIDLAPLPSTPAIPEEAAMLDTVTPEPPDAAEETDKPTDVQPLTDPAPEPVAEEPVAEPPVENEAAQEAEPAERMAALSEQPPLEEVVPDPVEAINPDVVVPLPEKRPVEADEKPVKPVETKKAEKKPVEKPKSRPKKEKASAPRTSMTASIDAKAAAPKSTGSNSKPGDDSKWKSRLYTWLGRHTRYPSAARLRRAKGTANVVFTVAASGQVTSVRLARSSGDADLDRAALKTLQGATVPAPPVEKAGTSVIAPLYFFLED